MCVACSQDHEVQQVDDKLSRTLKPIEQSQYSEGIYSGTKMKVNICGSYYITERNILLQ